MSPIMPWNKDRYPSNWKEIRAEILERAQEKCEWCGVKNYSWGYRREDGVFIETTSGRTPSGLKKLIQIVLTIAHLDNTPENNDRSNLAALCQRCHLNHDRKQHINNRVKHKVYKAEKAGQQRLELGEKEK